MLRFDRDSDKTAGDDDDDDDDDGGGFIVECCVSLRVAVSRSLRMISVYAVPTYVLVLVHVLYAYLHFIYI